MLKIVICLVAGIDMNNNKGKPKTVHKTMIPCKTAGTKRYRGNEKEESGIVARDVRTIVNDEKPLPNIWWYDVGHNDKTNHSAAFPEDLAKDHILSWSSEGDLVLDPFMGSGTTAKEAILLKRNFIGFDTSQEYCDIANKRITNIT
jgi:DNA modification methylase